MKRCAIIDDYQGCALEMADWRALAPDVEVEAFRDHISDEDALARRLAEFEIVCAMRERTPFPRSLFGKLPRLELLLTSGMRNLSIDRAAAKDHGVTVCGTPAVGTPTAELAWGLILALARSIPAEDRTVRAGGWQETLGVALEGKVLGVIGLGRLGARVAGIGKAFGMEVLAWSQNLTEARCREIGVTLADKETLLRGADVVTVHLLLSERTRGLIGASDLALLKKEAFLVNTSRGPIVDEAALIDTLERRAIAGAGLDVFDLEPLPADHPFRRLDNTVVTPHLGYVSLENYRCYFPAMVEDIQAWLAGEPIRVLQF